MGQKHGAMVENSISERLLALWPQLTRNQRRFVVAMQDCATKKEAAEAIGLQPDTVYRWPDLVDTAIQVLSDDIEGAVLDILTSSAAKAALVKVAGLDDDDDRLRQAVASEILDRILGKPTQRQELTGADGGRLIVEYVNDWRDAES